MSGSWSSPSSSSHSASFLIPTHNVTLTDIMENGFMADTFFSVNSTPFDSTYAEGDGFLKIRTSSRSGSFYLLPNNPTRMTESGFTTDINSLSCLMVTVPDSSKQTVDDLQKSLSTLSTSDALTSTCNAPLTATAPIFDLSALVSDQNGRFRTSSRSGSLYLPSNNPTLVESGFATVSEHNSRFRTSSTRSASLHLPSSNPTLMVESGFATEINSLNCLMLTVPDSNKLTVDDLRKGLSTSDTLASICNTPLAPNAPVFDLSALASEHNSRFNNSIVDYFCDNKISTPCKFKEIKLVSVEIPAPKSPETSEVLGDLSGLQKHTQLGWEISEIPLPPDNTLSPDASIEEWQSSAVVVDCDAALPQERSSFASAMSFQWTGAKPRTSSTLAFKSFAYESQSKEFESMASLTSSQSIKPFDFAIPSADERCNAIRLKAKKKY